jgi:hypothetical protein
MDQWEQDYVNAEDQAFIEFDESGGGEFARDALGRRALPERDLQGEAGD